MNDFISLTCPSCGSKLKITDDIDRFACRSCGNEFIVNRGEGIVTLKPLVEGLGKIQKGVDKTASELAIVRLQDEIKGFNKRLVFLMNEREKRNKLPNSNLISFLLLVSISAFVVFIGRLSDSNTGMAIIPFLVFLGASIGTYFVYKGSKKQQKDDVYITDNKIREIKNSLQEKNHELEFHKGIVKP